MNSIEAHQLEVALARSKAALAAVTEIIPALILIHQGGQCLSANAATEVILGYPRAEIFKRNVWDFVRPDYRELVRERALKREAGEDLPVGYQFPIVTGTGELRWLDCSARRIEFEGQPAVLVCALDVTLRKRAEEQSDAFAKLGLRLSGAATPHEAADIIVGVAADLFGWDACYLHLYASDRNLILPVLTMDTVDGRKVDVPDSSFTLDPSTLMLRVMRDGPQLIHRPNPSARSGTQFVRFGDKTRPSAAMMYVPIRHGSKTVGILSIQSYTPLAYEQEDLEILQALADHCGGALARIQTAMNLQRLERQLGT